MKAFVPETKRRVSRAYFAGLVGFAVLIGPAPLDAAELVMFEATGCEWCAAWDREIGIVYPRTEEGRQAPLRRVDKSQPRPADLAGLEGVVYTPTFVLMDRGKEIGRILGYPGESHFWGLLGVLLKKLPARAGG